jgi:hypothetical protein
MAGFDRSKLKATTASAMQTQKQEIETKRPSNNYERNILEIKLGDNTFRIFPYHPDSGITTYSVPKTVSFLTVTKPKRDDNGRLIEGEVEMKRSPIFNGKVHGNLPKDLVEEYMTVAKEIAIPNFTTDAKLAAKIWNVLTYAGPGSKAIKPSDVWVVYAMKQEGKDKDGNVLWGKVGELELKRTITTQMTEKAIEFSGDTQTPDIYTDADEGICVIINKSGTGKDTEYKVSLDTVKTKQGNQLISMSVPTPLTDEQIDAWLKLPPLSKKFVNSFKRKDLDYQIEGLQNFDAYLASQGYPINVFGYSEFVDVVEELLNLVPEGTEAEEEVLPEGEHDTTVAGLESDMQPEEEEIHTVQAVPAKTTTRPAVAKAPARAAMPTQKSPIVNKAAATVVAKPKAAEAPAAVAQSGSAQMTSDERINKIRGMMNKNKPAGQ